MHLYIHLLPHKLFLPCSLSRQAQHLKAVARDVEGVWNHGSEEKHVPHSEFQWQEITLSSSESLNSNTVCGFPELQVICLRIWVHSKCSLATWQRMSAFGIWRSEWCVALGVRWLKLGSSLDSWPSRVIRNQSGNQFCSHFLLWLLPPLDLTTSVLKILDLFKSASLLPQISQNESMLIQSKIDGHWKAEILWGL